MQCAASPAPLMQVNCSGKAQGGGLIGNGQRLAPQPACATGASIKPDPHVVAECPQPLACLHVPWGNSSGRAQTTISPRLLRPTWELPSRRCGSRSRVGPKHFRSPDNVVQQYPSGQHTFPTPPRRPWPIKRIFHAPSAPYLQQSFKAQVIQECSEPGASIANTPWATASMPTSSTNGFACLPENHGYPASVHPVAFSNARRGSHAQARCCDHEFDPVGP